MSNVVRLGWRNGKIIAGTRVVAILKDLGVKASVASRLCDMSIRSIIIPWKVAEYSDAMPAGKYQTQFLLNFVYQRTHFIYFYFPNCALQSTLL